MKLIQVNFHTVFLCRGNFFSNLLFHGASSLSKALGFYGHLSSILYLLEASCPVPRVVLGPWNGTIPLEVTDPAFAFLPGFLLLYCLFCCLALLATRIFPFFASEIGI